MLQVNIEKIIPVTEARDMFNHIIDEVEGTDELYVLTKNGKPAAIVVGVNHLEKLTGDDHTDVVAKIDSVPLDEAADAVSGIPQPEDAQESQDPIDTNNSSTFFTEDNGQQEDQDNLPSQDLSGQLDEPFPPLASEDNAPSAPASTGLNPSQPAAADLNPTSLGDEASSDMTYNNPAPSGPADDNTPMSEFSDTSDPFVEPSTPEPGTPAPANSDDDGSGPVLPPRQDY